MENICNSKNILAKKRNVAKNFGLTPLGVGGGIACSRWEKFPPPLHTYDLNVRRMFSVDENFEKKMHFQIQIYIYLIIRHPGPIQLNAICHFYGTICHFTIFSVHLPTICQKNGAIAIIMAMA